MSVALLTLGCIFGGTLLGLSLSKLLPSAHLSKESSEAIKAGAGMISMMSALVLGLLVSSAKTNFDSASAAIVHGSARAILLDRLLANYGPETRPLRQQLKQSLVGAIESLWPSNGVPAEQSLVAFEKSEGVELMIRAIRNLPAQTETQRSIRDRSLDICNELLLSRWLQIEQAQVRLPTPFLFILLFWLSILYLSFGLLAPRNSTVIVAMFVGALAIATALFLVFEMNRPITGTIKISNAPMQKALQFMGRE